MDEDSNSAAPRESGSEPLVRLGDWLRRRVRDAPGRTFVCGIVGLPGCGKSTLAEQLLWAARPLRGVCVSLDDFYLTADERAQRGIAFRGPPGTHDLRLLNALLEIIATHPSTLEIPLFDRGTEQRLPSRRVPGPLDLVIIEGWFVGAPAQGYERLADALDLLIYVDMQVADARAARLLREENLRNAGHGGMSHEEVIRFWEESLAPHFAQLVFPLRERADAVISLDASHRITKMAIDRQGPFQAPPKAGFALRREPSGDGSI